MKKILPVLIGLLLLTGIQSQANNKLIDDPKPLKIDQLITLAGYDTYALDDFLVENDYKLDISDPNGDFMTYKNKEALIAKRFLTKKTLVYTINNYTEGMKDKYADQIKTIGLTLTGSVPIENGIKNIYSYMAAGNTWRITMDRITVNDHSKLVITIAP